MFLVAILVGLQEAEGGGQVLNVGELIDHASTSSWGALGGKKSRPCLFLSLE